MGLARTWKDRLPEAYKKACQLREEYYKQKVNREVNINDVRCTQITLGGFEGVEELNELRKSYSSRYNALLKQVEELNAQYAIDSAALLKKLKK